VDEGNFVWGLLAAVTAAVTAYHMDSEERPNLRWTEAGIQGGAGVIAGLVVWIVLQRTCADGACPTPPPPVLSILVSSLLTGALIGALVPHWYRQPQVMETEYRDHRIAVTVKTRPDGRVIPTITLATAATCEPGAEMLPLTLAFASPEEAIARSIDHARAWIDKSDAVDDAGRAARRLHALAR
jgi:hypothetical protein